MKLTVKMRAKDMNECCRVQQVIHVNVMQMELTDGVT